MGWIDEVAVTADIKPDVAGQTVYFRVYDPDDPSADSDVVDGDTVGPDNRGGRGSLNETWQPTQGNGFCSTVLYVAHKAGDNHRVAAMVLDEGMLDMLDDATVPASNAQVPDFPGRLSPLLTVWRKLHVEEDSMEALANAPPESTWPDINVVRVESVDVNSPQAGQTTVVVEQILWSTDLYEGGWLNGQWYVISNTNLIAHNEIVVDAVLSQQDIDAIVGHDVDLWDDDGPNRLPLYPDLSDFVVPAFKPAYVTVEKMSAGLNPNTLVDFDRNLEDWEAWSGVGYDNAQDVWSSDKFWAALLVTCYQGGEGADQDPDRYWGAGNSGGDDRPVYDGPIDWGVTREGDDDNASAVFIEVQRDVGMRRTTFLPNIIAHEIGHSAGSSSASADHNEGGLMEDPVHGFFHALTLKRFRECDRW